MTKSVIYKALEAYQINLQIDSQCNNHSELNTIYQYKEYLENGGKETDEWLKSNWLILSRAVEYYRKYLSAHPAYPLRFWAGTGRG